MCNETIVPLPKFGNINIKVLLIVDALPGAATIIGNSIFILTLIKTSNLHRPSNVLLGALCLSDLLVGVIVRPLYVTFLLKMLLSNEMNTLFKSAFSKSFFYCGGLSFSFAATISMDRYLAICHPFVYRRFITCKKYLIFTVVVCIGWFVFTSLRFVRSIKMSATYNMILILYMIIAISIILVCYGRILQVMLKQRRAVPTLGTINGEESSHAEHQRNEKAKTHMVAVILGFFFLCYTPYLSLLGWFSVRKSRGCWDTDTVFIVNQWVNFFLLWNSCINPVVYCIKSREIRDACKRVLQFRLTR